MKSVEKPGDNRFEGAKELADAAEQILKAGDPSQEKATVAEFPNERTIRYYLTEGLLPPSLEKRGSTSVFGYQHLLSLLVIKKLQADGLPISLIRQLISGKSEDELRALLGDTPGREPAAESLRPETGADQEEDLPERTLLSRPMAARTEMPSGSAAQPPEKNAAREYLEGLLFTGSAQPESKLSPPAAPAPQTANPTFLRSAVEPPRTHSWRREDVAPGLELHIREDYQAPSGYREMKKLLQLIKDILRRQ